MPNMAHVAALDNYISRKVSMKTIILLIFAIISTKALSADAFPKCHAELRDENNNLISESKWQEDLYMGHLEGATIPILITTSAGNNKIMSLWVREKKTEGQAGMFSFVDLSSGKEQFLKFYMADQFSVAVTCNWN